MTASITGHTLLAIGTFWSQVGLIGSLLLFSIIIVRLARMHRSSVRARSLLPLDDAPSTASPMNQESTHA